MLGIFYYYFCLGNPKMYLLVHSVLLINQFSSKHKSCCVVIFLRILQGLREPNGQCMYNLKSIDLKNPNNELRRTPDILIRKIYNKICWKCTSTDKLVKTNKFLWWLNYITGSFYSQNLTSTDRMGWERAEY